MHHLWDRTAERDDGAALARRVFVLRRFLCFALLVVILGGSLFSVAASQEASITRDTGSNRADVAHRRARQFLRGRASAVEAGTSPAMGPAQARMQHQAMVAAARSVSLNTPWTPVGPLQVQTQTYGLVTGRVTSIATDPNDSTGNTVYVGTSGGGVWKSTHAAGPAASVTFTALTDTLIAFSPNSGTSAIPSLSIGALSVQPGGTGVILAGTGDPNDATDSYYGSGLLRSTDNGATWSLITQPYGGGFAGQAFAGFAWSTTSPQMVVAAVTSAEESILVQRNKFGTRGLYYSQDGGASWTNATVMDGNTVIQFLYSDYSSFNGNAATSVVWDPMRQKFYAAIRSHGYYESPDGMTFTRMANQPGTGLTTANCPTRPGTYGLASCPIFRGALAAQPVSGDLFALTVDGSNGDQGLWQDTCNRSGNNCASSTVTWGTRINAAAMESSGSIPQGDYNLALAAVPAATALSMTDTLLFAGTADLYRCSLSGGCSLRNTTNTGNGCAAPAAVAPAQHAIAWQTNMSNSASPFMFFGNDGGLWRSLDGVLQQQAVCSPDDATHFDNLNGALGSLAEISSLSSHPSDPNTVLAALGANGSAASTTALQAAALAPWAQLSSGESGSVAIDQGTGQTWLVQSGAGVALHACTHGPACSAADFAGPAAIGSAQVQGDASLMDPPALLDPGLNTNALVGTCRVFRGPVAGGSAWSVSNAISRFLAGPFAPACNSSDAFIRSLGAGGTAGSASGSQNSGSPVLYAGLAGVADGGSTYGGHLYATTLGATATSSTAWTDTSVNPVSNDPAGFNPGGFDISSIAVDPSDATGKTVFATIMGFGYPHVYRSIDGGNTWLNISANLPNAPANSVVVDPNNPLIVYVALDTGVYATQDVTTCVPAQTGTPLSCWGVLGTALPNAPVLSLVASRNISVGGSSGILRAGTFGRGIWQIPLLTAGQVLQPVITFAPASLTFGTQAVGSTSTAQTAILTNTGNAALRISTVAASSGFAETDTCAGASLTVHQSCTISVTFSPNATGSTSGAVTVNANVSGGYAALPVSGNGQGTASLILLPGNVVFPPTPVGSTSAAQTVTLANNGTGAASVTAPVASSDFNVSSTTCGVTLNPGSNCTISVSFSPSQNAAEIGTVSVSDGTTTYTTSLQGTGTGNISVSLSPASINFGTVLVNNTQGQNISVQTITVSNSGNASATLTQPVLTGDFALYHYLCPAVVAPGQSCSFDVFFAPSAVGQRNGTFTLYDGVTNHTVALTGTGGSTDLVFTPSSLAFGTVNVGSSSGPQTVTVSYNGLGSLPLGVLSPSMDFSVPSNTCTGSIGSGNTCMFTVVYSPTADGPRTGYISLPDAYHTSTHIVLLTGSGHGTPNVAVAPASLPFGAVAVNSTSAAQTVTLTNSGTAGIALSAPAVAGDFFIAANYCGATLAAGANCTLLLDFTPHAAGARTGTLTVTDANGSHAVALTGTGVGAALVTLAPGVLSFPQTAVQSTSAALTVTVNNGGTDTATLNAASITGDFAIAFNTCGSTLAAGSSCSVSLTFTPTASGNRTGVLSLPDALANHTTNLSGSGVTGALSVIPASITFPDTVSGNTSATRVVTVTNSGNGPLTISAAAMTGDFHVSGNCAGTTLAPGYTCTLNLTFSPSATGARLGALTVSGMAAGPVSATVALSGNGTGAFSVVLTPSSLDFGPQLTGTTSAVRNITISNTGTLAGSLGTIGISGDYTLAANTCGTSLPPQTGCTVSIAFAPTASGVRNGVLTVPSGAGTQTATLTGTGTAPATDMVSPASLTFAAQQVNTTSGLQTVTLTNSGDTALTLISAQVLTGDFTASNGCGPTLVAHSSCSVTVAFVPGSVGTLHGTLQITDVQRAQTVALTGTGTAGPGVSLLPSRLSYASTGVGVAGAAQTLILTNNGGTPLGITGVTVVGDYGVVAGTGTCAVSATLPVGGSCTLGIAFLPSGAGVRTGSVVVTSNAPTQTAQLTGSGVDFQLVANGGTTVTSSSGSNAVFPLLLRPLVTTTDPVTYTCTGAPANSTCKITAQYSDLSAVSTVSVTVLTGVKTSARRGPAGYWLLPLLGLVPWRVRRRGWCRLLVAGLLFCVPAVVLNGCGSGKNSAGAGTGTGTDGGTGGGGSTTPTPSGSYTLTASATAAGVTHSVPLTLVVQ